MRKGFTLIELAIVLVIIALVVGGVVVGRELVEASKVRGTVSQIEQYNVAARTFKQKYNCIPGDCANAVSFGVGASAGPGANGDGNGRVRSSISFLTAWGGNMRETFNFWYHLQQAGLIETGYTGYDNFHPFSGSFAGYAPVAKLKGGVYINAVTVVDDFVFGNAYMVSGQNPGSPSYTAAVSALEAFNLDTKLDDGLPLSGIMLNNYPFPGPRVGNTTTSFPTAGCIVNATNRYDVGGAWHNNAPDASLNKDRIECTFAIRAAW